MREELRRNSGSGCTKEDETAASKGLHEHFQRNTPHLVTLTLSIAKEKDLLFIHGRKKSLG